MRLFKGISLTIFYVFSNFLLYNFYNIPLKEILYIDIFVMINILFLIYLSFNKKNNILVKVFLIMWTFYLIIGWIGKYHFIKKGLYYSRNSSIIYNTVILYNILALLSLIAGFMILKLINFNYKGYKASVKKNLNTKNNIISFLLVINILVVVLYYFVLKNIPFFVSDADNYRFIINDKYKIFTKFIYILPVITCYKIHEMITINRNLCDYILVSISFILLIGYGSKMLFMIIIIVGIFEFIIINRVKILDIIKIKNILLFFIIIVLMAVYTNYRGMGKTVSNDPLTDIFIITSENRDATQAINLIDEYSIRRNTLKTTISSILPGPLQQIISDDYDSKEDIYFYKELLSYNFTGGSTRVGFLCEMYLNGGIFGIILGYFILGIIICFVNNRINYNKGSYSLVLLTILAWNIIWLNVSETTTQLHTIFFDLFICIILDILICTNIAKKKYAA